MVLRTAGSVLVVFLWSVTVVLGQDGWSVTYTTQSICTLKGSTVDLFCSYTYPSGHKVTTTFWFTKMEAGIEPEDLGQDPEYAGHLEYHGDKKKECTLKITDLRERDSATYKFRLLTDQEGGKYSGSPGVTLSVTGLQVKVTGGHQDKTLTCSTTCTLTDNPTYIWYKNGQHLDESTSPKYKYSVSNDYDASYSCAVKGHEDLHSPAVCVWGQSCNRVTYTKRRICVLKGSTVDISCTCVGYYSTTSSFWFRSDKSTPEDLTTDPGYAGRVKYPDKETRRNEGPSILRITDLREEDSAEYRFTFKTNNFEWGHSFPGTTLSVTGLQVKVTPAAEGQKTLTCITTCTLTDNPTYIWYKNGQHLDESTSPKYKYSVSNDYEDSYSCAVKGHEDLHSPAVCVQGQRCYRVTNTKRRICVLKGSTVDISCTYVGYYSTTSSFWFRSDKSTPEDLTTDPGYAGRVEYTGTYKGPFTLRITDLREEDSAEYRFTFKTDNFDWGHSFPGTTLSVTDLQVKVTPAVEGQKTLTCITTCTLTDNPTYIWYKNGQRLDESTSPQYKDPVYSNYGDSYSCAVKGHEDHHSPAVCVVGESCMNVTYTHQSICALKGSTVDISCFYTHPSWHNVTEVSWFNKWESGVTKDLSLNPEYADRVEYHRQTEKDSTLRITDLRESDSTEYKFKFTTDEARWGSSFPGTTLTVTGFQVEVTPKWSSEYKTLTCITTCTLSNPNPIYIWYKNGQHLDESTSPQYKDPVSSNHDDSYSCAVKGHEDLLSPAVCVQGQSCYRVTYTKRRICVLKGSTVDISCTYVGYYSTTSSFWFRSDKSTPEDLTRVPGYAGRVEHTGTYRGPSSLRITDLREEDSAEYRFTFKTNNFEWGHSFPGTTLSVTGLQVNVTPAVEGQKTLTCITTCTLTDNPTYIWYKNGQRLDEPTSQQYSSNILVVLGHSVDSYSCTVEHHEDLHSPAVWKQTSVLTAAVGIIVVVLVLILCLSGLMWFRKKNSTSTSNTRDTADDGQGDSSPVYDNISNMDMTPTAAQTESTYDQDDVHYSSVHFSRSKNQEVPLYSTVQLHQPQKQDQDVQYAAVKFNLPSSATQ
ncbi:sialoadhesin-like isoform X1 [Oncorhynchus kisutch]|uniref:sialoadhesin-like isoform X1 n=1 Tax=Oncorhynchus kisutch TaxID=8019 RepID=UPI0012DCEF09|nr:sialoadhesin-like isoform X1 [Oncorhynchus kisutch]